MVVARQGSALDSAQILAEVTPLLDLKEAPTDLERVRDLLDSAD